ncbi:glycosyltransferase family protein [Syntrophomonas erecta]
MKILVVTGDFSNFLVPNFHHLLTEVAPMVDLVVWHQSGHIQEIINQMDSPPDFVFINEFGETNSPQIAGLETLTIPYAVLLYDLHYQAEERCAALKQLNIQHVFSLYRDKFYTWYPEFWKKLHLFPHQVNTSIFKDYGLPKDIDYLLMGDVLPRLYPLRHKILETMYGQPGFVYHEHPGWRNFNDQDQATEYIGERYAREINRAKIFFTCCSIYKYPLLKYFEVPACNTLLLAPSLPELRALGFVDEVHFVSIDELNFMEKAEYYLNHERERQEIARQGYEMVQIRHSTRQRAIDFVNIIYEILDKKPDLDYNQV